MSSESLRKFGDMVRGLGIQTLLIQEGGYQIERLATLLCAFLGGITGRERTGVHPPELMREAS